MPDWDEVAGVIVRESPIHGLGLFASEPIPPGLCIGRYEGERTDENGMHVLWVLADNEKDWIGYDGTNALRYLNHSSDPNAELDGQALYSLRDIPLGEEITIDYGEWFLSTG
jgi:SET domain-containing protein